MSGVKDISGQAFGNWTVLTEYYTKDRSAYWLCRCSCGKEKFVGGASLRSGNSTSCGCVPLLRHKTQWLTHGLSRHPIYSLRKCMLRRCYSPKHSSYKIYGGRGISVCEEWRNDFLTFYNWCMENGWTSGLDIDRIDNDGDYGPNNCRFVSRRVNAYNRRDSVKIEVYGKKYNLYELESMYGIPADRIAKRIRGGWSIEKSLSTPVNYRALGKKKTV